MKLNFDGLTLVQVIKQSAACHPDWTPEIHRDYILSETVFEIFDLRLDAQENPLPAQLPEDACKFPAGCHYRALGDGHQLCFNHQVQLTRLLG